MSPWLQLEASAGRVPSRGRSTTGQASWLFGRPCWWGEGLTEEVIPGRYPKEALSPSGQPVPRPRGMKEVEWICRVADKVGRSAGASRDANHTRGPVISCWSIRHLWGAGSG